MLAVGRECLPSTFLGTMKVIRLATFSAKPTGAPGAEANT